MSPPDAQTLKKRLVGRGTESMEVIESRLARAVEEAQGIESYDYFIINDDLDACVDEVHRLIQGEHSRVSRSMELINEIRTELKEFQ